MLELDLRLEYLSFNLSLQSHLPVAGNIALLGESGSGKSSLLRAIAGLESATGRICFAGQQWLNTAENINLPTEHRRIGFVFQDYALFTHMNVYKNIAFAVSDTSELESVTYWLDRLKITDLALRMPASLSGGQKQRVAIARALASRPQCLLLDEPFAAIDFFLKQQLRRDLRQLLDEEGVPIILATHDVNEAQFLCDQAIVMSAGRQVAAGNAMQMTRAPGCLEVARLTGWANIFLMDGNVEGLVESPWGQKYAFPGGDKYRAFGVTALDVCIQFAHHDTPGAAKITRLTCSEGNDHLEVLLAGGQYIHVIAPVPGTFKTGQFVNLAVDIDNILWMT